MKSPSSQHSEKSKRGNYKNFLNRTFWVSIFVITGLSILFFLPDITFFGIELKKIDILSDIKKDSNKNASSGLIAQINNAHQITVKKVIAQRPSVTQELVQVVFVIIIALRVVLVF